MSKIIDKIASYSTQQCIRGTSVPFFSFEFFPPKTELGVENLYQRMDRMTALEPIFIDITWSAGGSSKDLTMAISEYSQTYFGVDVLMHLTCTKMLVEDLKQVLLAAKEAGIRNILALRGDPPKGAIAWEPIAGGCQNAVELVRLIRQEHGDYFCVAVAGFPEGHPQGRGTDADTELRHLRAKVDAGADFVLTQFFYDPQVFLDYVASCRATGIQCPVIPGMMPIQSFSSFQKMTSFCRTRVPPKVWRDLESIHDDDESVKKYGIQLCKDMCRSLSEAGVPGFHFYTLNLEKSVLSILEGLGVEDSIAARRELPWRGPRLPRNTSNGSMGGSGHGAAKPRQRQEDVRPINWANRPKSYIKRTETWDDFPNGRWGDGRSPAFGELSETHFYRPVAGSREDRLAMWGEAPISLGDVYEVFASYVEGRIPVTPWCETPLHSETRVILSPLAAMNRAGFLTINSQPAVNGEPSDNPVFGWGGGGGRVYQKAYVEFFTSENNFQRVREAVDARFPSLSYYAVDSSGSNTYSRSGDKGVTALTWGVFPNKEIQQPTIFDPDTFLVWSKEAFHLWTAAWAALYDDETDSAALLYDIHDSFYLVAIIDNDYVDSSIYSLFNDVMQEEGAGITIE